MESITLDEALACLKAEAGFEPVVEHVPLEEALHKQVGKEIIAPMNQPPFDRSPLDGYAFKALDSQHASAKNPVKLKVVGEVYAGGYYDGVVQSGEGVRIMTGAPIPKGCDCVLRQEDTDYGTDEVAIYKVLKPYDNYCYEGEDIQRGMTLFKVGDQISSIAIGVLASMGIREVPVRKKPCIGLICTGDELMDLADSLERGKIYNSNQYMLKARMQELGIEVLSSDDYGDDVRAVSKAIKELIHKVDLIVTTGGVSVGKKDIMHDVIKVLDAKRLFWRIKMQPGTPVLCSIYENKLIMSLSGNPFAALANFEVLVRPLLAHLYHDEGLRCKVVTAISQDDFNKKSKHQRFVRVYYESDKVYFKATNHSSGSLYSMYGLNALACIEAGNEGIKAGDKLSVYLL